ncbi:octopamine receptor-like isoform X1 [Macrobrachium nipponense]|uniref:octopamine receptor-like isoform X1 n=1 Tax=Macrobrachium nipponense TaxID=159736 RepID=UPI0030C837CF
MAEDETYKFVLMSLLPNDTNNHYYDISLPRMDGVQSQTFDSGGHVGASPTPLPAAPTTTVTPPEDQAVSECYWSTSENSSSDPDFAFHCRDAIETLASNVTCWITSLGDCEMQPPLPAAEGPAAANTTLPPGAEEGPLGGIRACLSCSRDNVTTGSWGLRFNSSSSSSSSALDSILTFGTELLCSFGSSAPCDNSSPSSLSSSLSLPSSTSSPLASASPPSSSIFCPSLPATSIHLLQCHVPDLLQGSQNASAGRDDLLMSANVTTAVDQYNYDFSFLFLAMFILAGGIGNILVCLAICLERRLHNVTNYFLMSLAVADLLVSLVVMPFGAIAGFLGYWPFGVVWCNIYVTCDVLACTSSIMHMCTISLGRYLGIRNPLKTRSSSKKTVGIKVVLVWLLAMLITSIITVLGIVDTTNIMPADYVCTINNQTFFIFGSLCAFYIPMVIMVVSYALTVHLLRKKAKFASDAPAGKARTMGRYRSVRRKPQQQQTHSFTFTPRTSYRGTYANGHATHYEFSNIHKCEQATQTPESIARETRNFKLKALRLQLVGTAAWHLRFLPTRKRDALAANAVANEQKASKVLGLVFFAFVICWTPFFLLNIYFAACPDCQVSDHLANVCLWLGYVSSTINPIIYTIFNKTFKAAFIKILKCDYNFDHRHVRSHSMSDNMPGPYTTGGPAPSTVATPCSIRTLSTYVKSPSYQHALTSPEQEQEHEC